MALSPDQEETILLYFHSYPSYAPAVVANVLFLLLGLWSLYRAQRCGARWTLWLPLTCFLETAGYAARLSFLRGPSKDAFIAQQALLVITPVFLAIMIYSCVGRLLRLARSTGDALASDDAGAGVAGVHSYRGCLRPGWVTCLFISSDVFSLVVQSSGAGLMVSQSADSARLGKAIIIGGLAIQLLFFFAFLLVTIHLHRAAFRGAAGAPYAPVLRCLYACVVLLTVRNCYRVAEFQQGLDGYLAAHEAFHYIFDFTLIFLCCLFMTVWHFGMYLGGKRQHTRSAPAGCAFAVELPPPSSLKVPAQLPASPGHGLCAAPVDTLGISTQHSCAV